MENLELNKELYHRIMDYARAKEYSGNTIKVYGFHLKKIMKKYPVLNDEVLRKILKTIKHQNQRAVLVLINTYCYQNNIDFRIVIPRVKGKKRHLGKVLSLEEVKLMVKSAPKPYDLMIRCIYNIGAGLRISEALKLSWNHIKWIDWLNDKRYAIAIIKDAKGGKDRTTMIPQQLMKDLYAYAQEKRIINEFGVPQGTMIFDCGLGNYKPDMLRNNKQKWKEEAIKHGYDWFRYNILRKHCETALGHKVNIHQLRHRRATYLYEIEKVPIERIQVLLGHEDLRTTLVYADVDIKKTFEMIKDTTEV